MLLLAAAAVPSTADAHHEARKHHRVHHHHRGHVRMVAHSPVTAIKPNAPTSTAEPTAPTPDEPAQDEEFVEAPSSPEDEAAFAEALAEGAVVPPGEEVEVQVVEG
jgi:hypothetical protein